MPRISVDLYMRASHLLEVKQTAKHTTKAGTKAAQARQVKTQDDWIKNIKIKSYFKDQDHQLLDH